MKIILVALLLVGSLAEAHSRLKASNEIQIRSTIDGFKNGPCGDLARVSPAVLTGGQTITVNWEETIYHPGHFEFYFSQAGETDFQLLKTVENNQINAKLPHQFSTQVTLPNVTCDNCTFQLVQVVTENPAIPSSYYSCADMKLTASGAGTGAGTAPTPSSSPPACP